VGSWSCELAGSGQQDGKDEGMRPPLSFAGEGLAVAAHLLLDGGWADAGPGSAFNRQRDPQASSPSRRRCHSPGCD
jgi:hypothetical protein